MTTEVDLGLAAARLMMTPASETVTALLLEIVVVCFFIGPLTSKPVTDKIPVLELKVRLVPDLGGRFPVGPVVNKTLQLISLDSSATFTLVVVAARVLLLALPVRAPEKPVDVKRPLLGL